MRRLQQRLAPGQGITDPPRVVDVGGSTEPAQNNPVVVALGSPAGEEPAVFARNPADAVIGFVDVPGPRRMRPKPLGRVAVFRVQRIEPGPTVSPAFGQAGVLVKYRVVVLVVAVRPRDPNDLRHRFRQAPVLRLAVFQCPFVAQFLADFVGHHADAQQLAVGFPHRVIVRFPNAARHRRRIRLADDEPIREGFPRLQHDPRFGQSLQRHIRDEFVERFSERDIDWQTAGFRQMFVDPQESHVFVEEGHAERGVHHEHVELGERLGRLALGLLQLQRQRFEFVLLRLGRKQMPRGPSAVAELRLAQ